MNITRGKIPSAKKICVYGVEGVGKSTFAAHFPTPLFIDTEDSTKELDVARFDKPTSWEMLLQEVRYVIDHPEVCKTLIIDTLDWAEKLCIKSVCAKYQKNGLESFDYGRGYTFTYESFGELLNLLSEVTNRGIHVVLTAHAATKRREQPDEFGTYDCWGLKLIDSPKCSIANMVKEYVDILLFVNYKVMVVAADDKGKKHKAQAILNAFGMAVQEAETPEEVQGLAATAAKALDAAPTESKEPDPKPAGDQSCGAGDVMVERAPKGDDLGSKLDRLIEMMESLQHKNDREEKALRDEEDLDDLIEKLTGTAPVEKEASVTIPADEMADMAPAAKDAAVALLKQVRPAVAAIKDETERSRVVDALLSTIKGPNIMGQVMEAAAANARKAADTAKASTFEDRCRESEAAYAARNPHKNQKED